MAVELREVTRENFDECIKLDVDETQSGYVATNLMSIAQAKVHPLMEIRAAYNDDEMVGFAMYGKDPDTGNYYLVRLMIDKKYQGKGYGRETTRKVMEELKAKDGCDAVYLFYVPENKGAKGLYESLGFEATGKIDEESGEIEMKFAF